MNNNTIQNDVVNNVVVGSMALDNSKIVNIAPVYGNEHIVVKFLNRDIVDGTRVNYEFDIKEFFSVNDVSDITIDMILDVTIGVAEGYRDKLISDGHNLGTVRTKLSRMKALFNYIMKQCINNRRGIRLLAGNPFDSVVVSSKGNSKYVNENNKIGKYGSLTRQEVSELIKIAGEPFGLLYEMAARTGIRKEALLNLRIDDIVEYNGIWCLNVEWDKTKGDIVEAITNEMYYKALEYSKWDVNYNGKKIEDCDKGKLFVMSQATVNNTLKRDLVKIGVSIEDQKSRKLCFHSLKKSCVNMASEYSNGNIEIMKNKAHHVDVNLTLNTYAIEEYDARNEISLQYDLTGRNVESELESALDGMYAYDLRELIMGMSDEFKSELLGKIENRNVGKNMGKNVGDVAM